MPFHWAGSAANRLTNDALDPVSRMPEFKVCAVSVSRADDGRMEQWHEHETQVVVVGHGMVGGRFVEELVARDVDRRLRRDWSAPSRTAVQPVLLTEVVAGRADVAALALPPACSSGRRRRPARGDGDADRPRPRGRSSSTTAPRSRYDDLVLATGAPRVRAAAGRAGGDGRHRRHVPCSARSTTAATIVAAAANARHAVVLGGGLLGLEAAAGSPAAGLAVTLVHAAGHLMARQLDPTAGAVLAQAADDGSGSGCTPSTSVAERHRRRTAGWSPSASRTAPCPTDLCSSSPAASGRTRRWPRDAGLPSGAASSSTPTSPARRPARAGDRRLRRAAGRAAPGWSLPGWEQAAQLVADLLSGGTRRPATGATGRSPA